MLQVDYIRKQYKTGTLIQNALDGVSVCFRDNEFVAVLGPSGSGKTTLLNIIGGLDRYDSGDLIINGVSTKEYKDHDWDTYRNHSIGFVFQDYNLISHQSILANVELALTIGGVPKAERRRRAQEALERVGLGAQSHKLPGQMSGGQMQRVAIARALVNDPMILLADEPTGALDSETSLQVMSLLKEVADDRLVIMVTHNAELAENYANRIVKLKDGRIIADSNEFLPEDALPAAAGENALLSAADEDVSDEEWEEDEPGFAPEEEYAVKPASMSFGTALQLSFRNLLTKKARTILVAIAGSIGIIGIALILAASNGVNSYISNVEENTLSEYPIEITSNSFSALSMLDNIGGLTKKEEHAGRNSAVILKTVSSLLSKMSSNDLSSLKSFLESDNSDVEDYAKSIRYIYDITPLIYRMEDGHAKQVNPYKVLSAFETDMSFLGSSVSSYRASVTNFFHEMPADESLYKDQYEVQAGRWPQEYNECVVVLNASNSISDLSLFVLGLADDTVLEAAVDQYITQGGIDEDVALAIPNTARYGDFLGVNFRLVNASDCYQYDSRYEVWTDKSDQKEYIDKLAASSERLTIVGVVRALENTPGSMLHAGVNYPAALTEHLMEAAAESEIVQDQLENPSVDMTTGKSFDDTTKEMPDLKSLFSVDMDKMKDSFRLNTNQLSDSLVQILSDAIVKNVSFRNIDIKKVLPTQKELNELLESEANELIPPLTPEEIDGLLKDLSPEIDTGVLLSAMEQLVNGFIATTDIGTLTDKDAFTAAFMAYLMTEDAGEILKEAVLDQLDVPAMEEEIAQKLTDYMKSRVSPDSLEPALEKAIESYARDISKAIAAKAKEELRSAVFNAGVDLTDYFKDMSSPGNLFTFDENTAKSAVSMDMDAEDMNSMLSAFLSDENASYEKNLKAFGYADPDNPNEILIYPKTFESKAELTGILDGYNRRMIDDGLEKKVISYTDMMGTMVSSVSRIVGAVSFVLVAFISISLVVSSIMIGVITYISVLERRKEIGILRSLGASKRNIASVFNAETIITGLFAGVIGVGLTMLMLIPANAILRSYFGPDIAATLPLSSAGLLVLLSVVLTLLGGLIPSRKAANSDPVAALRNE